MSISKDEIQQHMKEAINQAKNNPEFQSALKNFKKETEKYAPQAQNIEELRILKDVFEVAKEEAENLQRDALLGQDAD